MSDQAVSRTTPIAGKRLPVILVRASLLLVLTIAFFLMLNVAAHLIFLSLRSERTDLLRGEYFIPPNSPEGLDLLRRILATEDDEYIRSLAEEDPGIRPHPVLHFTIGPSRPHYRVGLEGIRYEPGWTDEQVRGWLQADGQTAYVMGGSTTFGHGVPGSVSLVAAMNRLDSTRQHLNLAVLAYDSRRESDFLVHLIRKGYRAGRVVFVDGLNDWITFCESPFPDHDKPRMQALLMDRGEVPLIYGYPRSNNMVSAFTFSFPIVQLIHRLRSRSGGRASYDGVFAELDRIDWPTMMYFYENWDRIQASRADELARGWIDYYRAHIDFVRGLGAAFGFESFFVYQPIGLLEAGQPFLRPAFHQSQVHRIFKVLDENVGAAIRTGRLDMIDCSRAIADSGQVSVGYVDATHYSPEGNEILARCIEENLQGDE